MKAPYLEVLVILVGRHTNIEGAVFKDGGAIKLNGALILVGRLPIEGALAILMRALHYLVGRQHKGEHHF